MAITGVFPGVGLTGGGITGDIYLSLLPATSNSLGGIIAGTGCEVTSTGILNVLTGGITSLTMGEGIGAPASGDTITTTGTIKLIPPTIDGSKIGGVKAGPNIRIEVDGQVTTENLLQTNNPYAYNAYIWPTTAAPVAAAPGDNGNVLTLIDKVTGEIGWTSTGSVNGVVAGDGLSVTTVNGVATVSLAVGTLTPATIGATGLIPTIAVNEFGQITSYGLANPYSPYQIAATSVPAILTLNFEDNNTHWEWTLQDNTAIQTPSNTQSGQRGALLLRQNPTSPFVVTWHTDWKFANSIPYGGNPVAGAVDLIEFTVVASNYIVVTNIVENIG